jgi:putative resolvase
MQLKDWAAQQGIHYQTARKWYRDGNLPVPALQTPSGTILVQPYAGPAPGHGLGLYARVSSHEQRADLDRRVARLTRWATTAGLPVVGVEAEVAFGVTRRRTKLRRLLADPAVGTVVTHRDRLARLNSELVEAALSAHGRQLVVPEDDQVTGDLIGDLVAVLTRCCARLYGRGLACDRTLKAVRCAQRDLGPAGVATGGDGDRVVG